MKTTNTALEIRVLGQFSLVHSGRALATSWPGPYGRYIFCSLLSPLGEPVTWDRLCRSLWDVPATRESKERIVAIIKQLNAFFQSECGIRPIVEHMDCITYDSTTTYLDAKDFFYGRCAGTAESFQWR